MTVAQAQYDVTVPTMLNMLLLVTFTLLHLIGLVLAPLGLAPATVAYAALLSMAIGVTPMWALTHEAIHGNLFSNTRLTQWGGRFLSILFGSPFRLLRHGHLHHHRHSRMADDRTEVFDHQSSSWPAAALAFYPRLLGGLYLGELLANVLFMLPRRLIMYVLHKVHPADQERARQRAEKELLDPAHLWEMRVDAAAILALYGMAFWLYGPDWWLLALVLAVRGLLISLVDNSFHYDTPLNDHLYALNLRLPRWASLLVLNFNMHRTHHRHVSLPWTGLPRATEYQAEDPPWINGILKQLRGPINLNVVKNKSLPEHWRRKGRATP